MALLKHTQLSAFLKDADNLPAVILIHGEAMLVKEAFEALSTCVLGHEGRTFSLESLEGGTVTMGDVIEQVTTLSFLVPKKMVVLKNAPLFTQPRAAGEIGFSARDLDHLAEVVENGIPQNHFLICLTAAADKRKKIYKTIEQKGLVIDCTVAQGARKADQEEQKAVLQSVAARILSKSGKRLDPGAFHVLVELTGFDLDLFCRNIEKLVSYSGDKDLITPAHVSAAIKRVKKDPIFSLTNALMDKDAKNALFFLSSLFDEGYHPLQILKAFENQFRKLILIKSATEEIYPDSRRSSASQMSFNQFRQSVMPVIVVHDKTMKTHLEAQDACLEESGDTKKSKFPADLLLAPNPNNAYPVYQVFLKSLKFSSEELYRILISLSDIDYRLKTSSFDVNTAIENFIINICSKKGFVYAAQNQDRRNHI